MFSSDSIISTRRKFLKNVGSTKSGPLKIKSKKKKRNEKINVLVIGKGGREHALIWKLSKSKLVNHCYIAPGNGGTKLMCNITNLQLPELGVNQLKYIASLVKKYNINLVVVGPEKYLEKGLVDYLHENTPGVYCFGPSRNASRLEWDKVYAKRFMKQNNIPTPDFEVFYSHKDAIAYIKNTIGYCPMVIKANGLAGGKGVIIAKNKQEAIQTVKDMKNNFGESGKIIIIEEYIKSREEMSLLGFSDGKNIQVMPIVYDYKKLSNFNLGPNTGGMGACCSTMSGLKLANKYKWILQKTIDSLRNSGIIYKGVLYAGLIKDTNSDNVKVLEFNSRFGDPETQVLMSLYMSDLVKTMIDCCHGSGNYSLSTNTDNIWSSQSCLGVVMASEGYCSKSGALILDKPVSFNELNYNARIKIFHSGTELTDQVNFGQLPTLKTNSGRILCVTGTSLSLENARQLVYKTINDHINIPNCHYRTDIGQRDLKVLVLGSTRGSNLNYLLNNIEYLPINIIKVISNKSNSGIITLAELNGISTSIVTKLKSESREDYDQKLLNEIKSIGVKPDIICLIGWMRILSDQFIQSFPEGIIYNVHPSLLPKFAGGMDLNVHKAVLNSDEIESGCTIHKVTSKLDGGDIIIQKKCPVYPDSDTVESLKGRVQELEGQSWIELFYKLQKNNYSYSNSGVNLENYSCWVNSINDLMKKELNNRIELGSKEYQIMSKSFNHFGSIIPLKQNGGDLIVCTDGVGTKLIPAKNCGKLYNLGIDLVAMCVNDLYCCGGTPLAFVDYIGYDTHNKYGLTNNEKRQIFLGIMEGCRQSNCYLLGGETAELSDIYKPGLFDLVGTAIGQVNNYLPKSQLIQPGDLLIGFSSNGVHANGFSLIRKLMGNTPPTVLIDDLLIPTRIYKDVYDELNINYNKELKALVHVTGGGIKENIKRLLPTQSSYKLDIELNYSWKIPQIFNIIETLLVKNGGDTKEMYKIFNMGIGMIAIMKPNEKTLPLDGTIIGRIIDKQD
jgi:phosphoribosylamine--glycine ligase/phosphoribosylglycinamide formyltransferase/phosphoribosylformylglycinamidine cyclo-ligase/phosphoribosylamine--glycine ligase/phosphoribosylformylglycinamidine cyclo-ligase